MNSSAAWQLEHVPATGGGNTPYSLFTRPIIKSEQDDREYRLINLENGIEALLIHDKETDKAAASMNIGVGHLSDPRDLPGLAHFCEHLLFMGTEQFPKENAYSEFIAQNGGQTNAYTATNNTNYHFSVSTSALPGALEHFSTFFRSPLFDPSCTTRELKAVDSEHKKNKLNDIWRAYQLDKTLARPDARWNRFGSGCWASLMPGQPDVDAEGAADGDGGPAGRETRRRLLEWYEKEYCASRMSLAVIGKQTLDELTELTLKFFNDVKTRNVPVPIPPNEVKLVSPWTAEQEGTVIFIKSIMDFKAMDMRWIIPWQKPFYRRHPTSFLSHFIGHEGPGSIHSALKQKGWIVSLQAGGTSGDEHDGFEFFTVNMMLTKAGWENYDSVIATVHEYVEILRNSPLPEWHHEESRRIAETGFRFQEKGSPDGYVTRLSEALRKPYERDEILIGNRVPSEYSEAHIKSLLGFMTPSKARVMLMGKEDWEAIKVDGQPITPPPNGIESIGSEWKKAQWYETEHLVKKIDLSGREGAVGKGALFLPPPNEFIPTNFEVDKKTGIEPLIRPSKILDTPLSTLWYKKDDRFWIPRARFILDIRSPLGSVTPRNELKTRLFGELIRDSLTEITYDASLAGLDYDVDNGSDGLTVSLSGYNDKLPVLLKVVLERIRSYKVNPERLQVFKEQVRQEYENFYMDQPYGMTDFQTRYFLWNRIWTPREKLAEMDYVDANNLQQFIDELLSRVHVIALVHGNIRQEEAPPIIEIVEKTLGARPLTEAEKTSMRSLILPDGRNYVYNAPVTNKEDVNSALSYYCHVGDVVDAPLRATLALLAQIISEPCFDQLRTKEQLGYIVSSSQWQLVGSMGFRIVVQSEKDPVYLESRVDVFLEHMKGVLANMDDEEFQKQKQSLIDKKLEKLKNLGEEAGRFWNQIDLGYQDFTIKETDAAIIKKRTLAEVQSLFLKHIHPSSPTRSKLSVHLRSLAIPSTPSPKFSLEAAKAFMVHLKKRGIPVQEQTYLETAAQEPPMKQVKEGWEAFFNAFGVKKEVAAELMSLLDVEAKAHPFAVVANGGEKDEVKTITPAIPPVYILDIAAFKARLTLSRAAFPLDTTEASSEVDGKGLPDGKEVSDVAKL